MKGGNKKLLLSISCIIVGAYILIQGAMSLESYLTKDKQEDKQSIVFLNGYTVTPFIDSKNPSGIVIGIFKDKSTIGIYVDSSLDVGNIAKITPEGCTLNGEPAHFAEDKK